MDAWDGGMRDRSHKGPTIDEFDLKKKGERTKHKDTSVNKSYEKDPDNSHLNKATWPNKPESVYRTWSG